MLPVLALEGLNVFPETPPPINVPPEGEADKLRLEALKQYDELIFDVIFTIGKALICTLIESEPEQPLASEYE